MLVSESCRLHVPRVDHVNRIAALGDGAYTLPDAAQLLGLPQARLRKWVRGVVHTDERGESVRRFPAGSLSTSGEGRDRHFDFPTLIELFSVAQLRQRGVTMSTLRQARDELSVRFRTRYPFALRGLLTNGKKLLKELGDSALLELGTGGQTAFEEVLDPFCHRLDFDSTSHLVSRFYPEGKQSCIVVDPHHSFGRPVIVGTNLTTQAIAQLIRGGENLEMVADDFQLPVDHVQEAWRFEQKLAA